MVGSLAIPLTVLMTLILFRRALSELIGRIISYEGMGQKFRFGQKLANAEVAVSQAVATTRDIPEKAIREVETTEDASALELNPNDITQPKVGSDDAATQSQSSEMPDKNNPLKRIQWKAPIFGDVNLQEAGLIQLAEIASSNPSFTVIKAYDELETAIGQLVLAAMPDLARSDPQNQVAILGDRRFLSESFASAFKDLRGLRDRVAHGKHNPTPGEAVTYVESARKLSYLVWNSLESYQARKRERFIMQEGELADLIATIRNTLMTGESSRVPLSPMDADKLKERMVSAEAKMQDVRHRRENLEESMRRLSTRV